MNVGSMGIGKSIKSVQPKLWIKHLFKHNSMNCKKNLFYLDVTGYNEHLPLKSRSILFQKVNLAQCADEKSNESVEDMDGTFAGW